MVLAILLVAGSTFGLKTVVKSPVPKSSSLGMNISEYSISGLASS